MSITSVHVYSHWDARDRPKIPNADSWLWRSCVLRDIVEAAAGLGHGAGMVGMRDVDQDVRLLMMFHRCVSYGVLSTKRAKVLHEEITERKRQQKLGGSAAPAKKKNRALKDE